MALRWTSALSLGVAELDAQHEELFRRFDRLLDAMLRRDRSEATSLIGFLQHYTRDHFAAEERLMREVAYPDAALHAAEHLAFGAEIDALSNLFAVEGASARLVLRLEREVTGWLQDHVYSTDHALARFLLARAPGPTPVTGSPARQRRASEA
ncbi:bacteriohemerythrin [Anaeromyxobacter sp. SG66]|uniref:bacteriohemerythrin n=1 Tax=Anaeromyxobacter sp. SG66 TaxID=2925410 RepID=UPI001F55F244|nr:bacteriohemerythrin [Anaeromyxobacter sp. SG66]